MLETTVETRRNLLNGIRILPEPRVLIVDPDPASIRYVKATLLGRARLLTASDRSSALAQVQAFRPGLIILDPAIPRTAGLDLMFEIHAIDPRAEVIIHTSYYSTQSAVRAVQSGAYDYLNKPVPAATLQERFDRWLDTYRQRRSLAVVDGVVGLSPVMVSVLSGVRRVAGENSSVLIHGETGTGKGLLARSLHKLSGRTGRFVICNCLAGSHTLDSDWSQAAGGTLLLDRIAELPLPQQARLMSLIESHESDLRLVAACEVEPRLMLGNRRFREDLYYHLAQTRFELPRLCDRKEDIPILSTYFLEQFGPRYQKTRLVLSERAQSVLNNYEWPGNVRELENTIRYACMMAMRPVVDMADLPDWMSPATTGPAPRNVTMSQMQFEHAFRIVRQCGGDFAKAAELLGIGRSSLYRILSPSETSRTRNRV